MGVKKVDVIVEFPISRNSSGVVDLDENVVERNEMEREWATWGSRWLDRQGSLCMKSR